MNDMNFNQIASVLNEIKAQVTGVRGIAPINTQEFVSSADTVIRAKPDVIMDAINQVLTRTIVSVRPYESKFSGLNKPESAYGNHIRKLSFADKDFSEDKRYMWPVGIPGAPAVDPGTPVIGDGYSVDQYVINKPVVLQTNFYGSNPWSDHITTWKDQLEHAFTGPESLGQFVSGYMLSWRNKIEQARESLGRSTLVNFMAGIIAENNPERVIHAITEYNNETGLNLDAQTINQPENYQAFYKWLYARIGIVSSMMTERTNLYQTIVDGKNVLRHTPANRQKFYVLAKDILKADAMVLANTYHDNYLKDTDFQTVNFWQSIKSPDSIDAICGRIGADGHEVTAEVRQSNIFGVLFDEEAVGYAITQQWMQTTPLNAAGGYWNTFEHETQRFYNDHTEKGVVILLD